MRRPETLRRRKKSKPWGVSESSYFVNDGKSQIREEDLRASPINRFDQPQRFFVRQDRQLHLIHHVGEPDFVFRIGERVTAPRARMTKDSFLSGEDFF